MQLVVGDYEAGTDSAKAVFPAPYCRLKIAEALADNWSQDSSSPADLIMCGEIRVEFTLSSNFAPSGTTVAEEQSRSTCLASGVLENPICGQHRQIT